MSDIKAWGPVTVVVLAAVVVALASVIFTERIFCDDWYGHDWQGAKQNASAEQQAISSKSYPNTREYKPRCDSPEDKDEADICAQREMAKGTSQLVQLARCQTGVGHLANFWLILAFFAALGAAIYAKKASDTAERTLAATERPWLKVEVEEIGFIHMHEVDCLLGYRCSIKNIGYSPATNIWLESKLFDDQTQAEDWVKSFSQRNADIGSSLFPNDCYSETTRSRLKKEDCVRRQSRFGIFPIIAVVVEYMSPNHKTWHTTSVLRNVWDVKDPDSKTGHALEWKGRIDPTGLSIHKLHSGNNAT